LKDITKADEKVWQDYDAGLRLWQQSDPSRRTPAPPEPSSYWARRDGLLYSLTKEIKYAQRARTSFLESSYGKNHYTIMVLRQIKESGV